MESNPTSTDELLALCERLIEGRLTPEDKTRLEALVLGDAEARRTYVEYMHVSAVLRGRGGAPAEEASSLARLVKDSGPSPEAGTPTPESARPRFGRRGLLQLGALAVMLALGAAGGVRLLGPDAARAPAGQFVATLVQAKGCRWEEASVPTAPGARLTAGRLRLAEGLATLKFASGAEVVIEGPSELELVSPLACVLRRGSLVVRVPPHAQGFVVRSATATLIDHGTEFGVTADAAGRTRVEVVSGLVEARHPATGQTLRLVTGEGALLDDKAVTRGSFTADPEPLLRPALAPARKNELVITTAWGRGQTAFVQGQAPPLDRSPGPSILLVKNTHLALWQRKSYVAFDISVLQGRSVADVSLTLAAVPSGYGHAAFVPDATFTIYGVVEDALDAWSSETIGWSNAPANGPGAAFVDPAVTVRVGSFVVPQGTSSGTFTVRGPALADLLQRDRNGLVTFIIVRDTLETHTSGLVHAFAGNHHPAAPPPTLRVVVQ